MSYDCVSKQMKNIIDDYFLHTILANSEIKFCSKHIDDFEGRTRNEFEKLLPVIRRVERNKRFLPHERLVYEPDPKKTTTYSYRHGKFEPLKIEFWLREGGMYSWPLNPSADETADNSPPRYRSDRRSLHLLQHWKYTKVHQYYRFDTFKKSPVHVFYKEEDPDRVVFKLHAISIPLDFLRASLYQGCGLDIRAR